MKTILLLLTLSVMLMSCSTEEPDPLFAAEELHGEYTLSVLVKSTTEDVGNPDERFIPVRQTEVLSYPYVAGRMSIDTERMSYHVNSTRASGEATDDIVLEFLGGIVITPPHPEKPYEFALYANYETELGTGASLSSIVWDGSLLKIGHSDSRTGAQYTLFWLKDTQ